MKQGIVVRAALAAGAAAGVVAISACSPMSGGAAASGRPTAPTNTVAQAPTTQPAVSSSQVNPPAAPTRPKVASASAPAHVYFPLCQSTGNPKTGFMPKDMTFSCDSTLIMQGGQWSTWNSSYAEGTATLLEDNCVPDCADGTMAHNPVKVRFDKPITKSCGEFYTEAVFTYVGKPVGVSDYKPQWTFTAGDPASYC